MITARYIASFTLLALTACVTGCGSNDNDPGVGGVTAGEARALNEAAEMLDRRAVGGVAATNPSTIAPTTPVESTVNTSEGR